jgi:hypothetical protein
MSKPKIFISHASSDRGWMREFASTMLKFGADIWVDELNLKPGDSISDSLEVALRGSDIVVLPITHGTVRDPTLLFELGAATSMHKRIIPIISEDVDFSQLPLGLSRVQYIKQGPPAETAEQLAKALQLEDDEAA